MMFMLKKIKMTHAQPTHVVIDKMDLLNSHVVGFRNFKWWNLGNLKLTSVRNPYFSISQPENSTK